MPVEGVIADAARGIFPVTWDALSRNPVFGDGLLQQAVDLSKDALFGDVIPVADEEDYPLRVIKFAGKLTALELITPGVDMWMNEPTYEASSGTNETHTFVDRAERLYLLGQQLAQEVLREEASIYALLGTPRPTRLLPRPDIAVDPNDVLLSPNPREFPAPFRQGTGAQRLT